MKSIHVDVLGNEVSILNLTFSECIELSKNYLIRTKLILTLHTMITLRFRFSWWKIWRFSKLCEIFICSCNVFDPNLRLSFILKRCPRKFWGFIYGHFCNISNFLCLIFISKYIISWCVKTQHFLTLNCFDFSVEWGPMLFHFLPVQKEKRCQSVTMQGH